MPRESIKIFVAGRCEGRREKRKGRTVPMCNYTALAKTRTTPQTRCGSRLWKGGAKKNINLEKGEE
jgi:hypothetical protein